MVAEDGYFLMVNVGVGLLEGCGCCGVRGVDGCDGGCCVWVEVLAGMGWRCVRGPLNGVYGCGGGLEC